MSTFCHQIRLWPDDDDEDYPGEPTRPAAREEEEAEAEWEIYSETASNQTVSKGVIIVI